MTPERAHVICRAFKHAWDESAPDLRYAKPGSGQHQAARCERCASHRYQWLDWSGAAMATWYEWSAGYGAFLAEHALTPREAKLWLLEHPAEAGGRRRARRAS